MTFSALSGVSFNLSRLFLRLCRWILVKMSLNCKCSASKQKMGTNFKLKKAKESLHGSNRVWKWSRHLLFLSLFGVFIWFIGFFYGLNDGASRTKEETLDLCQQHKARILLEHFNVSNQLHQSDQITSLKCTKKLGYEMLPRNVKVQHSENQEFGNQHDLVAENVELQYQCPVRDETVARKFRVSLPEDKSLSVALHPISSSIISNKNNREKNVLETRAFRHSAEEHCESFSFCLVKACWWVLLGVVLGRIMPYLYENLLGNQKQKLFQQQEQQQQQQTRSSSRSAGNWRKRLLYLFVAAGVIGSGWLFFHLNNEIAFRRKETLASMCDERARMLQDQFNVSMNHVHALAILVSTFHHGKQPSAIDQKTFGEYTERTSFERPLTSGVAYALRVLHSERKQFEKQHGWTIKKMENEDQTLVQDCNPENLDPSPLQDEYAPVIFSQETVSHIVSIDMMSGKDDRENILRARASGKGVLTSPFKLLKSNHLGVVLTFAVYSTHLPPNATPEQRINATVGYLGASYDVPSLVEKLLHQLASKQTIVVNVYDTTNKSAPIKMYGGDVIDTGLLQISNLDFGDPARKHEIQCRFKQKPPPPWTAIAALMGVLVITFLLGHIFDAAINRIAKVEQDFQEMMELKHRAEAADIAKSQFLATVSHEIRTPMNGVLGMLQRLMHTDLDANQRDCAETAHGCGRDLISLINEVLDQAKIESGRLDLEDIPFDLRDVLDKILSLFFIKSHEKGIELAVYVSNQIPAVVVGDPGRFRQIITNLVGNSIKFTHDKGHILVSVHLADEVRFPLDVRDEVLRQSLTLVEDWSRNSYNTLSGIPVVDRWKSWKNFKKFSCTNLMEETEKIKLLVTVEDTGVGIPQEAQCRIFMPFMQADSSTSRTYGGTGIGLSISKRLVDLMGGEIGFVSEPGVGSTFSFTAVLRKGETSSLDTMQQQYDPAVLEFQGLRALVVDDKSIRAEVTRYHLQRLGITTDVAFSLDSACAYLSSASNSSVPSHIAMILIDKDVWGMDASLPFHRLVEELRSNGRKEVPERLPKIFLLTTSISNTERNELKLAGLVDNVLMKPLRLNMLIFCFKEVLGIGKKRQRNRGKPLTGNLLRNKRILVVDDNVINRKVAEGVLKMYEAIVTCVDSGKAALEKLKPPHNFDACFMDLQMPEMDGFEATRQIRSLEREVNERIESGEATIEMFANVAHWHTPILAMTADVIQATNEECMKCGMDDYVSKPFAEEQLYSAVARFFESG